MRLSKHPLPDRIILFFATGFMLGKSPVAPGTAGTPLGLLPAFFLAETGLLFTACVLTALTLCAVWLAHRAEAILKSEDPGEVVIDEVAGMAVTLAGIEFNFINVLLGFFIFRILDITKPFPIRTIERKLSGGAAIVLDDIAAGIMGNIVLRLIIAAYSLI